MEDIALVIFGLCIGELILYIFFDARSGNND